MPDSNMDVEVEVEVETTTCDHGGYSCEGTLPLERQGEAPYGESWCEACMDDYASRCEHCEELVHSDDISTVGGYYGQGWCEPCRDYDAFWCEDCYEYYENDDRSNHQHGGNYDALMAYNDCPPLHFHGSDPHKAYLGLELEMEDTSGRNIDTGAELIHSTFGSNHFFCKGDGSLEDGMEMVSHPMTLSYWASISEKFGTMTAELRKLGMRSWNTETAGIHVHVSADAFEPSITHLWRFQQLFYRNPDSIARFAGRETAQWANLRVAKGDVTFFTKRKKANAGWELNRYMAVNLTNSATVEIRVFRGSLNPKRVMANLEFVHAGVEYTRNLTYGQVKAGALKFDVFAFWLASQPQYAHAADLINTKRITGLDSGTS